jgi:glycosyltransferase involved in cell wall biosynthesis
MASGAPVIAYDAGGGAETVTRQTGILFQPQTVEALMDAVRQMEANPRQFEEDACRSRAREFSKQRFQSEFVEAVRYAWQKAGKDPAALNERIRSGWAENAANL